MKMSHATPNLLSGRQIYGRLLGYVRPYRKAFIFAVLAMIVVAAASAGFAYLLKDIMDLGIIAKDPKFAGAIPYLIVLVMLVRGLAEFISQFCMSWVGRWVVFDIRQQMFDHLLRLPVSFYDRESHAALSSKLIYDVEQVALASSNAVSTLIKDSLTVFALIIVMAWLNWKLTLVIVVLTPAIALVVRVSGKRFRKTSRGLQDSMGDIASVSMQAFDGNRVVKMFGGYQHEHRAFLAANQYNRQQAMKKAIVAAATAPVMMILIGLALAYIIGAAIGSNSVNSITPGTFAAYIAALVQVFGPTKRLAKVNETIQAGLVAAQSAFRIIDHRVEPDEGGKQLAACRGSIEFDGVSFEYANADEAVLHGVSFAAKPGDTVALVGRSGSGKTTLASLLMRFYSPTSGRILVDGEPIQDYSLSSFRDAVSLVTQQTVLFNATIAQNIAYGQQSLADPDTVDRDEIDRDKLTAAAVAAHVVEFADPLPDGLDTHIGQHGDRLSGGQRQRIAIARALYKDAPILILDEATSALDSESERLIQDALTKLMLGRTTIVIAHRLSTIEHANKIIVLDAGEVVEVGSHAELIDRQGPYARLQRHQSGQMRSPA